MIEVLQRDMHTKRIYKYILYLSIILLELTTSQLYQKQISQKVQVPKNITENISHFINEYIFLTGLDEGKKNVKFPVGDLNGGTLLHSNNNWKAKTISKLHWEQGGKSFPSPPQTKKKMQLKFAH